MRQSWFIFPIYSCGVFLALLLGPGPVPATAEVATSPDDDFTSFALLGRTLHPDVALSYFDHENHSSFKGDARSKLLRLEETSLKNGVKETLFTFKFTFDLKAGEGNYCGWYFSVKKGVVNFEDKNVIRFEIKGTEGIPTDRFQIGIRSINVPAEFNQAKVFLNELGYEKFPTEYTVVELPVSLLADKEPGLDLAQMNDLIVFGIVNPAEDINDQHVWFRNATWEWGLTKTKEGLKVSFTNVMFDTGKSTIKPTMSKFLDKFIRDLKDFPGRALLIQGHTDNVGTDQLNKLLSKQRAQSVANYLIQKGGVSPSLITTEGFGPDKPIASNDTPEGRARNRRVDVTIGRQVQ